VPPNAFVLEYGESVCLTPNETVGAAGLPVQSRRHLDRSACRHLDQDRQSVRSRRCYCRFGRLSSRLWQRAIQRERHARAQKTRYMGTSSEPLRTVDVFNQTTIWVACLLTNYPGSASGIWPQKWFGRALESESELRMRCRASEDVWRRARERTFAEPSRAGLPIPVAVAVAVGRPALRSPWPRRATYPQLLHHSAGYDRLGDRM
jgi:hypothetical protein